MGQGKRKQENRNDRKKFGTQAEEEIKKLDTSNLTPKQQRNLIKKEVKKIAAAEKATAAQSDIPVVTPVVDATTPPTVVATAVPIVTPASEVAPPSPAVPPVPAATAVNTPAVTPPQTEQKRIRTGSLPLADRANSIISAASSRTSSAPFIYSSVTPAPIAAPIPIITANASVLTPEIMRASDLSAMISNNVGDITIDIGALSQSQPQGSVVATLSIPLQAEQKIATALSAITEAVKKQQANFNEASQKKGIATAELAQVNEDIEIKLSAIRNVNHKITDLTTAEKTYRLDATTKLTVKKDGKIDLSNKTNQALAIAVEEHNSLFKPKELATKKLQEATKELRKSTKELKEAQIKEIGKQKEAIEKEILKKLKDENPDLKEQGYSKISFQDDKITLTSSGLFKETKSIEIDKDGKATIHENATKDEILKPVRRSSEVEALITSYKTLDQISAKLAEKSDLVSIDKTLEQIKDEAQQVEQDNAARAESPPVAVRTASSEERHRTASPPMTKEEREGQQAEHSTNEQEKQEAIASIKIDPNLYRRFCSEEEGTKLSEEDLKKLVETIGQKGHHLEAKPNDKGGKTFIGESGQPLIIESKNSKGFRYDPVEGVQDPGPRIITIPRKDGQGNDIIALNKEGKLEAYKTSPPGLSLDGSKLDPDWVNQGLAEAKREKGKNESQGREESGAAIASKVDGRSATPPTSTRTKAVDRKLDGTPPIAALQATQPTTFGSIAYVGKPTQTGKGTDKGGRG